MLKITYLQLNNSEGGEGNGFKCSKGVSLGELICFVGVPSPRRLTRTA